MAYNPLGPLNFNTLVRVQSIAEEGSEGNRGIATMAIYLLIAFDILGSNKLGDSSQNALDPECEGMFRAGSTLVR